MSRLDPGRRGALREVERLIGESIGLVAGYREDAEKAGKHVASDDMLPAPTLSDLNAAEIKLLVAMRKLDALLDPPPTYSARTWERMNEAAQMKAAGATWYQICARVGWSFSADLRRPSRYRRWFRILLSHWRLQRLLELRRRDP